jgi:hypothetical protein
MHKPDAKRIVIATAIATVTTVLLNVMGAPLLRVIHNVFGRKVYWGAAVVVGLALSLINPGLSSTPLGIWLTVGLYGEFEAKGLAGFWTALVAVVFGTIPTLGGPWLWAKLQGVEITAVLSESISMGLQKYSELSGTPAPKIEPSTIIAFLPSAMICLNMTALALALIMDRKFAILMGLRFERVASQIKLLDFKLPDAMIWVMMISFLLSFVQHGNEMVTIVAINIFAIAAAAYMFQGLAVFEVLLLVLQTGVFWRILIYVFVVGQLFPVLGAVGIIDYWLDFRGRMKKWRQKKSGSTNGERI